MKCIATTIARNILLIALAISLSNTIYAQGRPYNDECFEAIQLPVAPETDLNEFSLEGAQRSTFAVVSTCGDDLSARDVWFSAIMPNNGKLDIELVASKECPNLTIYTGGCTSLGYLACDASKHSDTEKTINLMNAALAGQHIYIRVHQNSPTANNIFSISTTARKTPTIVIDKMDVALEGTAVKIEWTTIGESTVKYSFIQHSTDGKNFENVQSIKGRNNNDLEHYTIKHIQPQIGRNIYRIAMVLESGESMIFEQVEIFVEKFNTTARVFPNPTAAGIYLALPAWVATEAAEFTMTDFSGKIIERRTIDIRPAAEVYFEFANEGIANGNYLVQLTQKEKLIVNTQLSFRK